MKAVSQSDGEAARRFAQLAFLNGCRTPCLSRQSAPEVPCAAAGNASDRILAIATDSPAPLAPPPGSSASAAGAPGTPQSLKLTYPETLDRIKEEFQFLQTQYHRYLAGLDVVYCVLQELLPFAELLSSSSTSVSLRVITYTANDLDLEQL
ncbi:Transducin-like enhancer protein 1 [Acipenser ruthenus]|uniref:Transducin-like enhancer protein 1 n=1 Tax=Acipenser ruthenus TaxID=7906 RepID=A0A444UAG8_ACIRT|nr:Transducin-like enhancer protein 1 [Acipenser ruthenus]